LLFVAPKLDYARRYDPARWPHREILDEIYRGAKFDGGERKTVIVGTDSVRFNADNFALEAAEKRLPFQVATTAYETELNTLLPRVNSSAYFIYKEGGDPEAPFNPRAGEAIKEIREGGRFVELSTARKLPDGGVAHVFANLSPSRFTHTGVYLAAGIDRIPDCNVTFDGKLQLTGLSIERTQE